MQCSISFVPDHRVKFIIIDLSRHLPAIFVYLFTRISRSRQVAPPLVSGVSEQIPKEWQEKRKSLLPQFKDAKKQGKRARFVGPKLLVEGHFVTLGVPSDQA